MKKNLGTPKESGYTHHKILDMKEENKQLNRDCNDKDAIIQSLEADTSKILSTSLDENDNPIKAISDLRQAKIVMKDQTINEQAKEMQAQREISNITSFFFC